MPPFEEAWDTATTSNLTNIEKLLDGFDWDKRDKRLDGLPLMSSIWPSIFILVTYIILTKVVGPISMRQRNPMKLKYFAKCHNSVHFLCEFVLTVWLSNSACTILPKEMAGVSKIQETF